MNSTAEHDEDQSRAPSVSVGLPVYNGENYLAATIESILAQTYTDFELIINDNASSDRTQAICKAYAGRDARIRYYRNERNLGAGPNYDLCFQRARGEYFKWAAHDDLMAPDYLEKTVACLAAAPDAVLCCVGVTEIGPKGEILRVYRNHLPGIDSGKPAKRLAGMVHYRHQCEDFFGLFRRQALEGSDLHGLYAGSDRVLLAEMALRGRCVMVSDPLFFHREHDDRYTRAVLLGDRKRAVSWQNAEGARKKAKASLFHWVIYKNFWRVVNKTIADPGERLACYVELLRWWFVDYHTPDVVKDALIAVNPALMGPARAIKRALFGVGKQRRGSLPS
jgi:glycosyltransferase involved in cell wall biosynthesis